MAKNNSAETPLAMPKLPDYGDALFGQAASPQGLFAQSEDLLNPTLIKPYGESGGKMSPAAHALAAAQKADADLLGYTAKAEQERARQEAQEQARIEREQRAFQQASNQRIRQYEREQKEREKALKEKAKEQGGLLGAAPDGSFILDKAAKNIIASDKWKGIRSNLQRDDVAEDWLMKEAEALRAQGVADDRIDNELRMARNIIKQDTDAYVKQRESDRGDPLDVVSMLGKASRNAWKGAVLWGGAPLWNATIGKLGLPFDTEEFAKNENDAIASINETYSDKIHLAQENYEYLKAKRVAQGKDGAMFGDIRDAWNANNFLYGAGEFIAYTPLAVTGGAMASSVAGSLGAASGLTTAVDTAVATAGRAAAGAGTGLAGTSARVGAQAMGNLLTAETAGAMVTTGTFAATDAASGAYDAVYNQSEEAFKDTYIKANGQRNWDTLMEEYGTAGKARAALAQKAATAAGNSAFLTTALLGAAGVESTILKANRFGIGTYAGKRIATVGVNALSEALEEGLTQYGQNVGAQPATGVDLMAGVPQAAAWGLVAGGMMAGGTQVAGVALDGSKHYTTPKFDVTRLDPTQYKPQGTLDLDSFRTAVGREFDNLARIGRKAGWTENEIGSAQQENYDTVLDDANKWESFTPEQQSEFKEYLRQAYNINTNDYANVEVQPLQEAWESGNIDKLNTFIKNDESAASEDVRNAFRVKYGVELNNVPDQVRPFSEALARAIDHQITTPAAANTKLQYDEMLEYVKREVDTNPILTSPQRTAIERILADYLDAGRRRLTDAQQQAKNQAQAAAQNPTGGPNDGSNPAGQSAPAQDNQPVAGQSSPAPAADSGAAGNQTESVGQPAAASTGGAGAESVGNADTRQGNQPGGGQVATAQTPQPATGAAQAPAIRAQPGATATAGVASQATAGQGVTGQTAAAGQPAQPINSGAAPQTGSSGSAGVTAAERYPNGAGNSAPAQAQQSAVGPITNAYAPHATLEDAEYAWNKLAKSKSLRDKLALIGVTSPQTLLDLLRHPATATAIGERMNGQRMTDNTRKAIHDAIVEARDMVNDPAWVFAKLEAKAKQASANEGSIDAAIPVVQGVVASAMRAKLAKGAQGIYGLPEYDKATRDTYATKLLLDMAQVSSNAAERLDAMLKTRGAPKEWFEDNGTLKSPIFRAFSDAAAAFNERGIGISQSRPAVSEDVQALWSARATLFALKQADKDGGTKVYTNLLKAVKQITGKGNQDAATALMQSMLMASRRGDNLTGLVEGYYRGKSRKNADAAFAVLDAFRAAEQYINSAPFQNALRAEDWMRQEDKSAYKPFIDRWVNRNWKVIDPMLVHSAEKAERRTAQARMNVGDQTVVVTDPTVVSNVLADVAQNIARFGREYAEEITRNYAGRDENGNRIIKSSDVRRFEEQALRLIEGVKQAYLNGELQSANQPAQETASPAAQTARPAQETEETVTRPAQEATSQPNLGEEDVGIEMADLGAETAAQEAGTHDAVAGGTQETAPRTTLEGRAERGGLSRKQFKSQQARARRGEDIRTPEERAREGAERFAARKAARTKRRTKEREQRVLDEITRKKNEQTSAFRSIIGDAMRSIPKQRKNGSKRLRNGGFDSSEAAETALQEHLFQQPETVDELDELLQSIADETGIDPVLVGEYIAREWMSRPAEDFSDASTDELLDMVYDAAHDIWTYAGIQNENSQIESTKRLEGARSITADGRRLTRQSVEPTGALARALQPNLDGGAYVEIARPSARPFVAEPIATVEEIVEEFGGQEFSLAEIIEATENREGDKSPTLAMLAPEDNNAARPVISLTINGKTFRGRLFRWRDRKNGANRRHIVFVHDGDAFGMKGWDDKWIDVGQAVGKKRIDSINQNEGINITVLEATEQTEEAPASTPKKRKKGLAKNQPDLFNTEQNDVHNTENPATSGNGAEGNGRAESNVADGVGRNEPTDDAAGTSDVDNAGENGAQSEEGSGVSADDGRGSHGEEISRGELVNDLPQELDYSAKEVAAIDLNQFTAEERAALNRGNDTNDFISSALYNYAQALQDFGGEDSAVLRHSLQKMANLLADSNAKRRQVEQRVEETPAGQKAVADVLTQDERDIIEEYLDDEGDTTTTAEEFVEEQLADDQFTANRSLPSAVRDVLARVWNALRNGLAAISMAMAIHLGTNVLVTPTAEAATLTPQAGEVVMSSAAKASLDHIIDTNDNGGRPFVIADKKAGKLYLMNADGKVVDTTPALFGKTPSDSAKTSGVTGAGKYDLKYNRDARLPSGYAGSVQSFDTGANGEQFAIHRVIDVKGQNRQSRLDSKTARDNRITLGCINVPAEFYNQHLDSELGAVLYVLPETSGWGGNLYQPTPRQTAQVAPQITQTAVKGTDITPQQLQAVLRAEAENIMNDVSPAMSNASFQPVQVSEAVLREAERRASTVKTQPVQAQAPIMVQGYQPSTQVALISPVVAGGVSANSMVVPFEVHTPAEMKANGVFDTLPTNDKSSDGESLFTLATWLAAAYGGVKLVGRRKKGLAKRKKANEERIARIEAKNNPEPTTEPEAPAVRPTVEEVKTEVADNHDAVVEEARHDGTHNLHPKPLAQAVAEAIDEKNVVMNKALWIDAYARRFAADEAQYNQLATMMINFEYELGGVLTDTSYLQGQRGDFNDRRKWRGDITDRSRVGALQAFMRFAGGATVALDNWLRANGSAAFGHEADSAVASKMLAQVRSKSSGAYAQLHKTLIHPLVMRTATLASQLRMAHGELETDTGRVATVQHVLNEGAKQMWKGAELEIAGLQAKLASVETEMRAVSADGSVRLSWAVKQKQLLDEITAAKELLDRQRAMYYGDEEWDNTTPLPGGYTEKQAQAELARLEDKYGKDFHLVRAHAKELVEVIRGIRNFAAAAGVVTNAQLAMYNELGFKEYVPLYRPQQDPNQDAEKNSIVQTSRMDRLLEGIPLAQARTMGLTRDVSQFKREGATSPAEDAYTNMKVYAMNTAGRVGQQGWIQAVQQLYEGTIGKPYSSMGAFDEEQLKELNSKPEGKMPGLIRVRPGMEDYLPGELQAAIAAPGGSGRIRPIRAKGLNSAGESVDYHYYFTDKAIQQEVYYTSDVSESVMMRAGRNLGTITRFAARMMTTFRPVWNVYNWVRDSIERVSIMLARPVKDSDGNLVNRWTLTKAYAGNLARLASSLDAQNEIMRYLATGEVVTELQRTLDEAVGEGAINLMTTQTDKHSIMSDLRKSQADRLVEQASRMMGAGLNKAGLGKGKAWLGDVAEWYVQRMTEVPQVTTALASYMAYKDLGVNKHERSNRVRDQYDPTRSRSEIVRGLTTMYPFVRSTFAGHYNLMRTLSEYWNPGERGFTTLYLAGGVAAMYGILAMAAGAIGNDDDGVPLVARMPMSILMNGIPIRTPDGGIWSAPVGFGLPKLMWGTAVNLFRTAHGEQSPAEMGQSMLGLVMDNTSPIQVASGAAFDRDVMTGVALTASPLLAVPFVEMMTNTKAYTGQRIYSRDTPLGEKDSAQGGFAVPEAYKDTAKTLQKTLGIDLRPETLKHLLENFSYGPLKAIPTSILADKAEKTLGQQQTKGEAAGAVVTALGLDMAWSPNALNDDARTYNMVSEIYPILDKYGISRYSHDKSEYDRFNIKGKENRAARLVYAKLVKAGAPEWEASFVRDSIIFETTKKKQTKDFQASAMAYMRLKQLGEENDKLRLAVEKQGEALNDINQDYLDQYNQDVYEMQDEY